MDSPGLAPQTSDLAVAAAIASHLNGNGQAWPSVQTLAAETRLDRKAVLHAISQLEHAGLLVVTRRLGRGNHYTVADKRPDIGEPEHQRTDFEPSALGPDATHSRSPHGTGPLSGPVRDRSPHGTRTENGPALKQKQRKLDHPRAARTKTPRTQLEPDLLAAILALHGSDQNTPATVRDAGRGLAEGAFRNALEATCEARDAGRITTSEIAYFVGTLQHFASNGQYP